MGRRRREVSYLRPITHVELVKWLLDNSFAEEREGFGHVTADTLAAALIQEFDVVGEFRTPYYG